jgi:hypothetical protein
MVALMLGYSATPVELFPQIAATRRSGGEAHVPVYYGRLASPVHNWFLFTSLIHSTTGVIEAQTISRRCHAVAYQNGRIYDPDGREFDYSREACEARGLYTQRLWRIEKVQA